MYINTLIDNLIFCVFYVKNNRKFNTLLVCSIDHFSIVLIINKIKI